MASDNQYTALGPAEIGFQTDGANIRIGSQVEGTGQGTISTGDSGDGVVGYTNNGAGSAAGVHGISKDKGNSFGVFGEAGFGGPQISAGIGVSGIAGVGVYGQAFEGPRPLDYPKAGEGVIGDGPIVGVHGRSVSGTGVRGDSQTGSAFYGTISNPGSGAVTILGSTHGTASAIWGAIENAANGSAAVAGTTNGPGPGLSGSSAGGLVRYSRVRLPR